MSDKKKQWGMLFLAIIVWLLVIDLRDAINSFYDGFNGKEKGYHDIQFENAPIFLMIGYGIGALVGLLFGVLALTAVAILVGAIFYRLLFRNILIKTNGLSLITFVIILLVIEGLFHDLFCWIFDKTNTFNDSDLVLSTIQGYASSAFSFVLISAIIAYGFIKNSFQNARYQSNLLKEKTEAEIRALKAQINPHFLFNTLNNLFGTAIVENSPKTAGGIEQLAGIMRHVVEGSKNDKISVEKEIKFLHDYIEIQLVRLPQLPSISVKYDISWDEIPAEIPPLLLMTFIENAFKYGISTNQDSYMLMNLIIDKQQLTFVCKNSKVNRTNVEEGTGTGIENTVKRLKLLYPEKHQLRINDTDKEFFVDLNINLA